MEKLLYCIISLAFVVVIGVYVYCCLSFTNTTSSTNSITIKVNNNVVNSRNSSDCIEGNGKSASETRLQGSLFSAIILNGSINLHIQQSESSSCKVSAESNILPHIITRVKGNTLVIETTPNTCISSTLPMDIFAALPNIDAINLNGAGDIDGNINYSSLSINLSGSGNIKLKGNGEGLAIKAGGSGNIDMNGAVENASVLISGSGNVSLKVSESFDAKISGSGNIDMNGTAKNASVSISGSGDISLEVSENLDAKIKGSGNIAYRGNPIVTQSISGLGYIRKK